MCVCVFVFYTYIYIYIHIYGMGWAGHVACMGEEWGRIGSW